MTDRDRLIELVEDGFPEYVEIIQRTTAEAIADHLLANGVILPPCKVGDTLYFIPQYLKDWLYDDVEYIRINDDHILIKTVADFYFEEEDFGKTVFLTKEEAEQALKEREKV